MSTTCARHELVINVGNFFKSLQRQNYLLNKLEQQQFLYRNTNINNTDFQYISTAFKAILLNLLIHY